MSAPSRTLYDEHLVTDLFNKVRGKSSLAKLSAQTPIPFNGSKEFTFTMDNEIDIVAENGAKTLGGVTMEAKTIVPIKFEYGARISDEFMYASEEEQIPILQAFNDGFAAKVAKGFDIAAMHGFNPRTNTASTVVGTNNFDSAVTTNVVDYAAATPDDNLEDAIALITDGDVNGIAMSKVFASDMAKLTAGTGNNVKLYPEFAFGAVPENLNGIRMDANVTVNKGPATYPDHAIVGDFANAFKWGFSKQIPLEVIQYGDPDNTGSDLKGHNQVYLRTEVYLGWCILAPEYFARIVVPTPGA